ncbi:MAG: tetratricopeptide repeat protein [Planctomycetales bacterium]|nr:tetratricopeptide repeat protein [Planctomycetales bacterium]
MTDRDSKRQQPKRIGRLLLVLAVVAILWATVTTARLLLPPAPLKLARASIKEGHFDRAIEQYRQHLEKNPNDWAVHGELGLVLSEVDRPQALEELRKVPADSEAYGEASRHLVSICLATERLEEAERTLVALIDKTPEDWWPQLTLAELYFRQGRPREALPYAQRSTELSSELPEAYFLKAEILDDLQRPAEMIEPLQKLIDLDLENYAAHINLSYAYSEAGESERSQEEAEWCLARNTNDVNAYRFLAKSLRDQGHVEKAMETIEKGLTLSPYDLECRLLEAELLIFNRREEVAFKHLESLYEQHHNDRRLVALLGRAAAASGRTEEAKRYREQAQKLSE